MAPPRGSDSSRGSGGPGRSASRGGDKPGSRPPAGAKRGKPARSSPSGPSSRSNAGPRGSGTARSSGGTKGRSSGPPRSGASARTGGSRTSTSETSARGDRGERGPKSWGGLARRGAGKVGEGPKPERNDGDRRPSAGRIKDEGRGEASKTWRKAVDSARPVPRPKRNAPAKEQAPPRDLEEWVLVEEIRDEAEHAVERAGTTSLRRDTGRSGGDRREDAATRKELDQAVGASRGERIEKRLRNAAKDFEAERFPEAARRLRSLGEQAPTVPAVRELYGLTLYRQGKWRLAAKELEAFRTLSGSSDQHPVLADCYRALHQWRRVEELWDELREASPSGELVTEGRIVMAGSLADRGKVSDAIHLLEQGWRFPKRPKDHHLRRAYALADLYERAGDVTRARELFGRIRAADASFADVRVRLRSLG